MAGTRLRQGFVGANSQIGAPMLSEGGKPGHDGEILPEASILRSFRLHSNGSSQTSACTRELTVLIGNLYSMPVCFSGARQVRGTNGADEFSGGICSLGWRRLGVVGHHPFQRDACRTAAAGFAAEDSLALSPA